eukprot:1061122-Rhodomonas_salina.1
MKTYRSRVIQLCAGCDETLLTRHSRQLFPKLNVCNGRRRTVFCGTRGIVSRIGSAWAAAMMLWATWSFRHLAARLQDAVWC